MVRRIIEAAAAPSVRLVRVDEGGAGQRLDNFLIRLLKGVPKTHVYRVIRSGEVRVNKGRAAADTRLAEGDEVRVPPVRVAEREDKPVPGREFPILFEDDHLIAVDKPAGVPVHPLAPGERGTLLNALVARHPEVTGIGEGGLRSGVVHRLDVDTSGVLLFALEEIRWMDLREAFRSRKLPLPPS